MANVYLSVLMLIAVTGTQAAKYAVWPPPQDISLAGSPVPLLPTFQISMLNKSVDASGRLGRACDRMNTLVQGKMRMNPSGVGSTGIGVKSMTITVESADDFLGLRTTYDYTIQLKEGDDDIKVTASSIYGAIYALESFWQLIDERSNMLHATISIKDAPQYAWRGLMLDAGRRFFPVPLVENLMDTMVGAKLNVLHLHASDMCRFGVESKLYPNLTSSLTGVRGGFYTQDDITSLIAYGGDRGIRVVPEFDFPGHSRGYIPAESDGVEFCEPTSASRDQLFGDAAGKTYKVVHDLMSEMSKLFTDEVFNIGCDETSAKGQCTVESTYAVERKLFTAIATEFGKTPEGWEEAYFDAGAATNNTIINTWARHTASEVTALGRRAVESKDSAFYFTGAAPGGPAGWKKCWYDIATNIPTPQLPLLLGGEMSMWTDSYCYIDQCGSAGGSPPVGHELFGPAMDAEFSESVGGMIWPRGFVGAAAFWNFDANQDPSAPDFVEGIYKLSESLRAKGSYVCPQNCSCDQLTACGIPYIKAMPPSASSSVVLAECTLPVGSSSTSFQSWSMDGGMLKLNNTGLCLQTTSMNSYPLQLTNCTGGKGVVWSHSASGEIISLANGNCIDVEKTDMRVGNWECGPAQDQPNQHWSFDSTTGLITSLTDGTGPMCISVVTNA
eukprot:m.186835 g.186835  ORF g.186835 m.186835 type:complete len:670 (-) comp32283_c0_seq1:89-2098(-)